MLNYSVVVLALMFSTNPTFLRKSRPAMWRKVRTPERT